MTATYDPTLGSNRDLVRLYLGDTVVASALFSDEEIAAMLTTYVTPLLAAAALADALSARFTRWSTLSIEGFSVQYKDRADGYRRLAALLRSRSADGSGGGDAVPVVSGVSRDAMRSVDEDTDHVQPSFKMGMFDAPGTWPGIIVPPELDDTR